MSGIWTGAYYTDLNRQDIIVLPYQHKVKGIPFIVYDNVDAFNLLDSGFCMFEQTAMWSPSRRLLVTRAVGLVDLLEQNFPIFFWYVSLPCGHRGLSLFWEEFTAYSGSNYQFIMIQTCVKNTPDHESVVECDYNHILTDSD